MALSNIQLLFDCLLTPLLLFLSYAGLAQCYPTQKSGLSPIQQSSDAWAQVIANVAPLMTLVGERNAKEYMRTASSWCQLLTLATAPLGVLSIMVSAIRLSGPGFLRRLVGRDSERRSEALVELTSLSVAPATSVYTPRAVEIEPAYSKDRVAFVCAHVQEVQETSKAASAFRELLSRGSASLEQDKEAVLAIWRSSLGLSQVAELADFLATTTSDGHLPQPEPSAVASLSYRTTSISPAQTATHSKTRSYARSQLRDLLAATFFALLMIGIQVLGFLHGSATRATFWMGIVGYLGVVSFTSALLVVIKGEVVAEADILPSVFQDAFWTFSDSRHAEHWPMKAPDSNTLIIARPLNVSAEDRLRRNFLTSILTFGIVSSYVVYYLSMRVSPWWVPLGSLIVIWLGAAYRALVSRNFLIATAQGVGNHEHWIGLFRNTVNESLLATLEGASNRPSSGIPPSQSSTPSSEETTNSGDYLVVEPKSATSESHVSSPPTGTILFVSPPIRTAMRTWSGSQDVMKVGLQMAKNACKRMTANLASHQVSVSNPRWLRIVRFHPAIYVPGLVWCSRDTVDFALTKEFDLESLTKHLLKLLHICMDHPGGLTRHAVPKDASTELSHVLCGPIADPPIDTAFSRPTATLREVLTTLRDNASTAHTSKYSLEQAVLLPTVMLACIYDRWLHGGGTSGGEIEALQNKYADKLALSGQAFLETLEAQFAKLGLWNDFMTARSADRGLGLAARDATSSDYTVHNMRDQLKDATTGPLGEDGHFGG
jgi:hypothetical protein